MNPPLVLVETPYAGNVHANLAYARLCMADSVSRGEAPFLSHLLYTQGLGGGWAMEQRNESDKEHWVTREKGMELGRAWRAVASKTVLYVDLGESSGMVLAEVEAHELGKPVERRRLSS